MWHVKAQAHFEKGERLATTQAKLDPATDWESIVEGCYMGAHNFVLARAEWSGASHPQGHMHRENVRLLTRAGALQSVKDAWDGLEILRAGNVYEGRTNGTSAAEARRLLQIVRDWAAAQRP
jgi:hypothetical protein